MKDVITIIGPNSRHASGGMASVTKGLLASPILNEHYILTEYPSCKDGSLITRLTYSAVQFLKFLFSKKSATLYHIHLASYSSTWRKFLYFKIIKKTKARCVLHVHGGEYAKFLEALPNKKQDAIKRLFKEADVVVVLAELWKKYFTTVFNLDNVVVVNNGIDSELYNYKSGDGVLMAFVGNLSPEKGVDDLLAALSIVAEGNKNFCCYFVGGGDIPRVKGIAGNLGILDNVVFTGLLSEQEVAELLRITAIMVLPSYHEGFPMSILEAMSAGNAIVSTSVGGIPEIVSENGGILVEPGDVDALANAVRCLLCSCEQTKQMGVINSKRVNSHYDIEIMHKELLGVYDNVVHAGKKQYESSY
ncbi:MAG: glycosyltransferase family 4 protein [Raoultibacter sp.]